MNSAKSFIWEEIRDLDKDLQKGAFGILEPKKEIRKKVNIEDIDLIITPGIVFDREGNRIGYGRGYYDKLINS